MGIFVKSEAEWEPSSHIYNKTIRLGADWTGGYLCVKGATWVAEVVGAAEDEPRKDFFFLDAFQSQLQILSRASVVRLHVVTQQAQNLHRVLQDRLISTIF